MEEISLLEASEQCLLYLKASENVSDSGQSQGRASPPETEVDRKTESVTLASSLLHWVQTWSLREQGRVSRREKVHENLQ